MKKSVFLLTSVCLIASSCSGANQTNDIPTNKYVVEENLRNTPWVKSAYDLGANALALREKITQKHHDKIKNTNTQASLVTSLNNIKKTPLIAFFPDNNFNLAKFNYHLHLWNKQPQNNPLFDTYNTTLILNRWFKQLDDIITTFYQPNFFNYLIDLFISNIVDITIILIETQKTPQKQKDTPAVLAVWWLTNVLRNLIVVLKQENKNVSTQKEAEEFLLQYHKTNELIANSLEYFFNLVFKP